MGCWISICHHFLHNTISKKLEISRRWQKLKLDIPTTWVNDCYFFPIFIYRPISCMIQQRLDSIFALFSKVVRLMLWTFRVCMLFFKSYSITRSIILIWQVGINTFGELLSLGRWQQPVANVKKQSESL